MSPQPSLGVDLLRPVLSMPPVVLVDGGCSANSSPRLNIHSIPPSPIVEMPPSPAPTHHQLVDYPVEEDNVYEYDEEGCIVEVRKLFLFSSLCFVTNISFGDLMCMPKR